MGEELDFNKAGDNGEKRIFKIKVDNIAPEDVDAYIKAVAESFKKPHGKFIDPEKIKEDD